jgi:hypothetical protein
MCDARRTIQLVFKADFFSYTSLLAINTWTNTKAKKMIYDGVKINIIKKIGCKSSNSPHN